MAPSISAFFFTLPSPFSLPSRKMSNAMASFPSLTFPIHASYNLLPAPPSCIFKNTACRFVSLPFLVLQPLIIPPPPNCLPFQRSTLKWIRLFPLSFRLTPTDDPPNRFPLPLGLSVLPIYGPPLKTPFLVF